MITKLASLVASSITKSLIVTCGVPDGASLSMIVALAHSRAIVALALALVRRRKKSSGDSTVASSVSVTRTVLTISPAAKVRESYSLLKSAVPAVPEEVPTLTVITAVLGLSSRTRKSA